MDAITTGPAWLDAVVLVTAVAAALTGLVTIWRLTLLPTSRAVRVAFRAAPRIAADLQELKDLVRGDVLDRLDRLDAGAARLHKVEERLSALEHNDARQDALIAEHTRQLAAHGQPPPAAGATG